MENLIFLFATSFVLRISSPRKFKSYLIGETGCSALLLTNSRNFERVRTRSGDHLYFTESREGSVRYGIIFINLKQVYENEEADALLRNYLSKLQKTFTIQHNTGLKSCDNWNNHDTTCLVDYWQDADKKDWKVKGYTNGSYMAILYVRNIGDADVKRQDLFLDSFHFPQGSII